MAFRSVFHSMGNTKNWFSAMNGLLGGGHHQVLAFLASLSSFRKRRPLQITSLVWRVENVGQAHLHSLFTATWLNGLFNGVLKLSEMSLSDRWCYLTVCHNTVAKVNCAREIFTLGTYVERGSKLAQFGY